MTFNVPGSNNGPSDSSGNGTSGFNSPQPSHGHSGGSGYEYGRAQGPAKRDVAFKSTNPLYAPWALWVSAVAYLAGGGWAGWLLYERIDAAPEDAGGSFWIPVYFWIALLIGLVVALVFALKAQQWARWVLSAYSVLGILLIVVGELWISALFGIAAVILLWLPVNKWWFGYTE